MSKKNKMLMGIYPMKKKEKSKYEKMLGEKKVFEMTPEELEEPITKEMGELCRHRLEKRWYRRLIELNIIMIIVVVSIFVNNYSKNMELAKEYVAQVKEEFKEDILSDDSKINSDDKSTDKNAEGKSKDKVKETNKKTNRDVKKTTDKTKSDKDTEKKTEKKNDKKSEKDKLTEEDIPFEVTALGYGLLLIVVGYLGLYIMYAQYRCMSLRITESNFPEVYDIVERYAKRLGIQTPKTYVAQSNGILNAFSTFIFRRQWICIHSELFEVAYREHKDMDALKFVIAHEMAHIYYGHATLHYNIPIWFAMQIPLIGSIASRTREYSCDRLAQRLTGVDGIDAMLILVIDRHLYKMVDKQDYINEMRSIRGFFVWLYNLFVSHPVMSKRILALNEGRGSGRLY
ncbi:MAG: M48 family metallopeptidase [Lachnospiraceae bacterium]|nr:M48 family metallopeptidase [Lachnospiraceae bacterium]